VNLSAVSHVLAGFVGFFGLAQALPLALSLGEAGGPDLDSTSGFVAGFVLSLISAGLLWFAGRSRRPGFYRRETLCVAVAAWILAGALGAIPLQWSGLLRDPCDALFESVSGLTTCGGTVLGTGGNPTPEDTPGSLLLWRALMQWLGGLGIVLVFVALLPAGAANRQLLIAESVGVANDGFQPRLLQQARWIAVVYTLLTLACAALLMALGGMGVLDAACHAFSALATGGFSTKTSVAVFDSLPSEVVLTTFMFLGGCSFAVMAGALRTGVRGLRELVETSEFRMYTLFTIVAITLTTADLVRGGMAGGTALRQASFNVVSMLSCCGFATADFHAWPPLSLLVIFTCSLIGGCTGSAAGGLKQVRALVCLRLFVFTLQTFVQPKRVERIRLDGHVLPAATVSSILAMVLLWLTTVMVCACLVALDQRLSFLGALSASASMLGNCGPAMAAVDPSAIADGLPALGQAVKTVGPNIGPLGGFGELAGGTKILLSFEMILGRLELLPMLALFMPSFWRR
jgi:trk system potassium uptake protein TrkH